MLRAAALFAALSLAACASTSPPPRAHHSTAYADYLIGRIANMSDDYDIAADRYFAALTRAPRDPALLNGAVVATLATGDVDRARRAARMAPAVGAPGYAHLVRASDALATRRWPQAVQEAERTEGPAAEQLLARMLFVWARTGQGRVDEVTAEFAPLARVHLYGGLFAYQQAMMLDYAGRDTDALAAYQLASESGLWLPAGVERHADLLARTGARDRAIALLDTDANRGNAGLVAALARVQAGGAVASQPLTPAQGAAIGLYGMAGVFQQEHDATSSLASLTLSLMLDPGFDGARIAFAQQQNQLGHEALARRMLAQIGNDSPYSGTARILESWVMLDTGDEAGALTLASANAASGDVRATRTLADMYRNLGRFDEAEPLYARLIEQSPGDWRLYFARGAARERLGRWPEAEADFQEALRLSPDQPDVLNYLGYSWVDRGERLQEGLALVQRAVELRPLSGAIIDSLGWAYFRLGDYPRALELLERAVELEPADPTLNDHLGDVYWRVGRRIEARFQWERALGFEPEAPDTIRAKLENGLPAEPPRRSATR